MNISNKTVWISGAAAGIGQGIARLFADYGARISVMDVDAGGLEALCGELSSQNVPVLSFAGDVRERHQVEASIRATERELGPIDILINNAGIYPREDFLSITPEEWDRMQDVNLKSMFHACQLALPAMVDRRAGKIINISSVTFLIGAIRLSHYVASKGGVIGFTRALAKEFGPHNIHVNCISPGAVEVESERKVATAEQVAAILKLQPLPRRIVPLDIARVCLFLGSELSDGMTGQMVNVDGGLAVY